MASMSGTRLIAGASQRATSSLPKTSRAAWASDSCQGRSRSRGVVIVRPVTWTVWADSVMNS